MRTIKVGIIGTGFIGPAHVEALRRLGSVEVVGLAESNPELAKEKAKLLGIPQAYGDYKDLLKDSLDERTRPSERLGRGDRRADKLGSSVAPPALGGVAPGNGASRVLRRALLMT